MPEETKNDLKFDLKAALVDPGFKRTAGHIYEDQSGRLSKKHSREVYREMEDLESSVGAFLFFVRSVVKGLTWRNDPVDPEDPKAVEAAEFIDECQEDMRKGMPSFLDNSVKGLLYGWKLFETVYKERAGRHPEDKSRDSMFSDGKIGWRKWMPISCLVTQQWVWDEDDEVVAVWVDSYGSDGVRSGRKLLPMAKAIHIVPIEDDDSPEGRSAFKGARKSYNYKKRHEEIEAVVMERLNGYPILRAPAKFFFPVEGSADSANTNAVAREATRKSTIANGMKFARDIRADSMMGGMWPGEYDDEGKQTGWGITNLTASQPANFAPIIQRYANEIVRAPNADVLVLGEGQAGGNRAIGDTKLEILYRGVAGFTSTLTRAMQEEYRRLLVLNGIDESLTPIPRHSEISEQAVADQAALMDVAIKAGIKLNAPNQQKAVLDRLKLPEPDEDIEQETEPEAEPAIVQPSDEEETEDA